MTERTVHRLGEDELEHAVKIDHVSENSIEVDLCGLAAGFAT